MKRKPKKDMPKRSENAAGERVRGRIFEIRGQRVILDADLAEVYGVETKILNKAVGRNKRRFPDDFAFRLTAEEVTNLRFQNGTSSSHWGGARYPPYAFTEHGAIMAANVLRSRKAEEMSVFVVRAFVKIRPLLLPPAEPPKKQIGFHVREKRGEYTTRKRAGEDCL